MQDRSRRTRSRRTGQRWEERVGQLAVYPGHGVVRIEAPCDREIEGRRRRFLQLRMLADDSRILVPWEKLDQVGLRTVIRRREAARIWEILRARPRRHRGGGTWSRQFREYREKLRSGSVFEIAEVVRDLLCLQLEKELSFGEHRVLDTARSLLVHELAAAEKTQAQRIEQQIRDSVS